jgi:hypothetical protein
VKQPVAIHYRSLSFRNVSSKESDLGFISMSNSQVFVIHPRLQVNQGGQQDSK